MCGARAMLVAGTLLGAPLAAGAEAPAFDAVVAFGDSMSDDGFDDGHGFLRYSNGKVWVEYLGEMLGASKVEVRAWSGAMSGQGNYNENARGWSGLGWQVDRYAPGDADLNRVLFTAEIGLNDLHDPNNDIAPETVVANLTDALDRLADKGARHLLVWNIPTGVVPPGYTDAAYEFYDYYNPLQAGALDLFAAFNEALGPALDGFEAEHPEVTLYRFDANKAMNAIKAEFEITDSPWLGTYAYPEPNKWLYYDHWHFMTEPHRRIAAKAAEVLGR